MSENTQVTRPRLAVVNRRQMVMRAIEVERLIEEDHPARSIWELRVEKDVRYPFLHSCGKKEKEHLTPF